MKPKELLESRGGMLRLTFSIFAVQFMSILVSNVDQLMISRYSQTAVAAVGNANQLSWVLMLLFEILCMSSVILITQYKGAENTRHEQEVYALSLLVNITIGIAIGLVCIFFGHQLLDLMNVEDPAVERDAYKYIAISGGSSVLVALIMTYSSFMRGNAMMREAMIVSIGYNLLNVLGNWLLIYGVGIFPELGVTGAAISTMLSRLAGAVVLSIVFRVRIGRIKWSALRPFPREQLRKLLHIGVPSAGEGISYDLSQLVIMSFVNTLGLVAVNTKIYVALVSQAAYVFTNSLGEATQVAEGYLLGAKRHDEADRRVMRTLRIGMACSLALTTLLLCFSDQVLGLFIPTTGDAAALRGEILALGKKVFTVELLLETGRAVNMVMVKALQGAGDALFPALMCVLCSWMFGVGLGWVLGIHFMWGLAGIWLGVACDECVRGGILVLRWKRGGWRRLDLVTENEDDQ